MPINFLRHYYDLYNLFENKRVLDFIGSDAYKAHKEKRFRSLDEQNISKNFAFTIPDKKVRKLYSEEFTKKSVIYFKDQPKFEDILQCIEFYIDKL